ncbi:MAG: hypothetical protein OXI20_00205 [Rhodospirillales bacterium]|nr:hypothetical protein [Rhodospirillales bacterium]
MKTKSLLFLLSAAVMLAVAPGDAAAGDMAREGGVEVDRGVALDQGDIPDRSVPPDRGVSPWPEHAASDGDAARAGRAAMPFTAEQIEALGRLLQETQRAASVAADPPPAGRVRRVRIGAPGEGSIPTISLRKGYVTAVSFTDATGAPWPIEDALMDGRFTSETVLSEAGAEGSGGAGSATGPAASHLLYLAPQARSLHGNAAVKLLGLAEPLVLRLRGGGADADFRVEIRLGLAGPNAEPATTARADFHAGDPALLDLLGGIAPPGAERLAVDGGSADDRAWRLRGTPWSGGDLLLVTRAHLLSPGPWAAERGAGGRWAYRLPDVPYALVSRNGHERRLAFRTRDDVLPMPAINEEGERQ